MADHTAEFFDELTRRGHDPRLAKVAGVLRFDLAVDGGSEHWTVEFRQGEMTAVRTPQPRPADCVLRTTKGWFDRFVTGADNILAALLRADVVAEGNLQLMFYLQRLMPDPPGARDPRDLYQPNGKNR